MLHPDVDFPALANLLNDAARVDSGSTTTEAEQKDSVTMLQSYGYLGQWIVDDPNNPNNLIAYVWFFKQAATPYAEFTLTIHQNNRERELEKRLLEVVVQEAKSQQASYLYALIDSKNPYLHEALLGQGFRLERGYHAMEMPITTSFPEPVFPEGFSLRTYDQVNDMNIMVDIVNRGWSDLPGHKVAGDNNVSWVNQQPHDSIFLLFDNEGKIIGSTGTVILEDGSGRIDAGGLVPEYRTPALYRSLALVALNYAIKQGCKKVKLESWGDYESTIDTYKQLGFVTVIHELGYRFDGQKDYYF